MTETLFIVNIGAFIFMLVCNWIVKDEHLCAVFGGLWLITLPMLLLALGFN